MVEYVVVLVFGVMVLMGPGGDMMLLLLKVINDRYQGYTYSVSLSRLPDHDSLGAYLVDTTVLEPLDPNVLVNEIGNYTNFPTLESFPTDLLPSSPGDLMDGATSFF